MLPKGFSKALARDLPVLFAKIGCTVSYDGTEGVIGGASWVRDHPRDNGEASAFKRVDGVFRGFAGHGPMPDRFHIVFVAVSPVTEKRCIVGVYADAWTEDPKDWGRHTRNAFLIPFNRRRELTANWSGNQGIRRWAKRDAGKTHPSLLREFNRLKRILPILATVTRAGHSNFDQTLKEKGKLVCEVPGCGFEFRKRYGIQYAHVHHLTPLSTANGSGRKVTLSDLAIVCANCHAMIHYKGLCRNIRSLIPIAPKRK